jgi:hypothetical protein
VIEARPPLNKAKRGLDGRDEDAFVGLDERLDLLFPLSLHGLNFFLLQFRKTGFGFGLGLVGLFQFRRLLGQLLLQFLDFRHVVFLLFLLRRNPADVSRCRRRRDHSPITVAVLLKIF